MPRRCSKRQLIASVGPLLEPGCSKNASTSVALRFRVLTRVISSVCASGGQGGDHGLHHPLAFCPVGGAVCGHDPLIRTSGHFDTSTWASQAKTASKGVVWWLVSNPAPVCRTLGIS